LDSSCSIPTVQGHTRYKCVEPLVNGQTKAVCDVLTGTYPDRLFNKILKKTEAEPRIFSLESLEPVGDAPGNQILKHWLDLKILAKTVRQVLMPKEGL
jgi:hypothetical protein